MESNKRKWYERESVRLGVVGGAAFGAPSNVVLKTAESTIMDLCGCSGPRGGPIRWFMVGGLFGGICGGGVCYFLDHIYKSLFK